MAPQRRPRSRPGGRRRAATRRAGTLSFRVLATDGAARAGILETAHGSDPDPRVHAGRDEGDGEVAASRRGARARRRTSSSGTRTTCTSGPARTSSRSSGGIHAFSGWDGPILTDSGGFQVFSLRDTILALDDEGVTFRSVYDGAEARFTPEGAAEIQRRLGSDIAMCLDVCVPDGAGRRELERAVAITTQLGRAAGRGAPRAGPAAVRDLPGRDRPGASAPLAGADLRAPVRRARARRPRGRRVAGGDARLRGVGRAAPAGRTSRATSWGSATRPGSSRSSRAGSTSSTACCRRARRARARRSRGAGGSTCGTHASPVTRSPLEQDCGCPACARFSRAYLRHLVTQDEILGLRLLSLHNLWFVLDLTARARAAIERGTFTAFRRDALARLAHAPEEES